VLNNQTHCTIVATNNTTSAANVTIDDTLPNNLQILPATITGASQNGNGIHFAGSIAGASPPGISVAPGASPFGYFSLSNFGIAALPGADDSIFNFNLANPILYGGEQYTQIGFSSNGIAVVGGGSAGDATPSNQILPSGTTPNNDISPFWTDLLPGGTAATGTMKIAELQAGAPADRWIVLEWENVPEFSTAAKKHSFQIWIGEANDAHPVNDVSFVYSTTTGNGDGGFLTVGAENRLGNSGTTIYYNGTGVLPVSGASYQVSGTAPTAPGVQTIQFDALAVLRGSWRNCATMTSSAFIGTSYACIDGDVH